MEKKGEKRRKRRSRENKKKVERRKGTSGAASLKAKLVGGIWEVRREFFSHGTVPLGKWGVRTLRKGIIGEEGGG